MSGIDAEALTASLRRLAGAGMTRDLLPALHEVVSACVDLFGVSGSGIMVSDEQNVARYVAATDGPGKVLETAESETGQGPCTEAYVHNRAIATSDLVTDPRWPEVGAAVEPYHVRAVLGVPVRLGGVPVGTLDVYVDQPHEWDEVELAALLRYGEVVEATLAAALSAHRAGELADQLQYALDYRVIIERGVGYLMARDGSDAVEAFNRLRLAARSSRSKIGAVAEELLATGRLPSDPESTV
jgi:transcriptional regulator with GAF, ATPase, and Fis domain